jgi:hypothetical protein
MKLASIIKATVLSAVVALPMGALACEGMGPNVHVGNVVSIDAKKNTFTIKDAQSQSPVTFTASQDIINALHNMTGVVRVNYAKDDTQLKAVGVTF